MKNKCLFIINPKSGTRSKAGIIHDIHDVFGSDADVVYTKYVGHATELTGKGVEDGYARIVAVGGDGTVNEIANALVDTDVPLSIIPMGSGNGLARHLGLPMRRDAALAVAKNGKVASVDCGRVAGKNFFCTMGLGFDALVSREFAQTKRRGLLTYSRIAIENLIHYRPQSYRMTVDGKSYELKAFIIAVCNAAQYGNNAFIAPHASMADGLLDVTIVHPGNLGSLATAGVRLFTHSLDRSHIVHCLRGSHITIDRAEEGPGHIDGESMILPASLDITCRPQVLKVVVSK
ncbi:MAG: diacylglycerol kinase family lipid kinase [Muribaculaceae bacterium]|nr:diacylglycerol kinase family lipid kinase [Muribaculaceae bacterium]